MSIPSNTNVDKVIPSAYHRAMDNPENDKTPTTISVKLTRSERDEWQKAAAEAGLDQISSFVKQVMRQYLKDHAPEAKQKARED